MIYCIYESCIHSQQKNVEWHFSDAIIILFCSEGVCVVRTLLTLHIYIYTYKTWKVNRAGADATRVNPYHPIQWN